MAEELRARIVARLDKARRKLATARMLLEQKELEDAAGRAYYAMYHAAYAVLLPSHSDRTARKARSTVNVPEGI